MTKKTVFNFIKTPCGQAKYIELEANKTLLGKFRLLWFILIASFRDFALGLIGIIPGTFLYCSIGSLAKSIQELKNVQSPNNLYITSIGIISTFLVVYFSAKYSREYFEKS